MEPNLAAKDGEQIFGNEEADKLAKKSLKDTSAISTKVILTDLKIKSKIFVKNLWKDRWAKN